MKKGDKYRVIKSFCGFQVQFNIGDICRIVSLRDFLGVEWLNKDSSYFHKLGGMLTENKGYYLTKDTIENNMVLISNKKGNIHGVQNWR